MIKYVLRRLIQAIPTFFGITLLAYILMTAAPGGPLGVLYLSNPKMTEKQKQTLAASLGVNDPVYVQYLRWLVGDDWMRWDSNGDGVADHAVLIPLDANGDGEPEPPGTHRGALRGDFGDSFFSKRPVLDVLSERVVPTLELGVSSLVVALVVGIPLGILAAVRRGGLFDNFTRVMAVIFDAIPSFWLGLILILFFGSMLKILPLGGRCKTTLDDTCPPIYQRLDYLILPVFVLSTQAIAGYSRFTRASMLDIISQDFIRTARAKGLSNRTVWFRHAARNALMPIATFLGPSLTGLLAGAVITETIFSYPGLGRALTQAAIQRDYPVVMAATIYAAIATILGFLLSDVLYAVIDPRVRFN
jgi:peptide/nickel transport system permease protein